MRLYPTTLFHFTNKHALYAILRENFKISYAREKIIGPTTSREFAVPMVSFCDLKLSELKYFLNYGKFGIGLTKEWANSNHLSPVQYVNRHSYIMDNLISGINGIYNQLKLLHDIKQSTNFNKSYMNVLNMYRYIKNYEGELWRNNNLENENYRFADEREWRYVPNIDNIDVLPFISISNIRTKQQKIDYNNRINHLRLSFTPEDIKYLVVEKDSDITDLINHLQDAKSRFSDLILKRLTSRIMTIEQIENDI